MQAPAIAVLHGQLVAHEPRQNKLLVGQELH